MNRLFAGAICFCFVTSNCTAAKADLILEFANSAGIVQSDFEAEVGHTVDISVYLVETSPSTILFDEGLFSAGFRLNYSTGGGSSVATIASASGVTSNPAFDLTKNVDIASVPNAVGVDLATNSLDFGLGLSRIKLASFQFAGVGAGSLSLTLSDLGGENSITQLGTVLDGGIDFTPTANLKVTAVPEPNSLVLLIVGSTLCFLRKRRTSRGAVIAMR